MCRESPIFLSGKFQTIGIDNLAQIGVICLAKKESLKLFEIRIPIVNPLANDFNRFECLYFQIYCNGSLNAVVNM